MKIFLSIFLFTSLIMTTDSLKKVPVGLQLLLNNNSTQSHVSQRLDGLKRTKKTTDEIIIIEQWPDGTLIEQWPSGTKKTTMPDKTIIVQWSNRAERTTMPNGTSIEQWPDGKIIEQWPNGIKIEQLPDGIKKTTMPDKTVISITPNGTIIEQYPNKILKIIMPDGKIIEQYPNGLKRTSYYNNELQRTTMPNGTIVEQCPNDELVVTKEWPNKKEYAELFLENVTRKPNGVIIEKYRDRSIITINTNGEMTEVYCNISETIVDGKKADETKDQDSKAHCPKGRRFHNDTCDSSTGLKAHGILAL